MTMAGFAWSISALASAGNTASSKSMPILAVNGWPFSTNSTGLRSKPGEPRIILIPPIGEIVAAFFALARMVAGFIGGKGCCTRQFMREIKQLRCRIVIQRGEDPSANIGFKPCARLNRELVKREVGGAKAKRLG